MSSSSIPKPWSTNPNAPPYPEVLHLTEKYSFMGSFLGAICYGLVIGLFFRCLYASFHPVNRVNGRVRWGPVIYTVVMFSFITAYNATYLDIGSTSYIDHRNYFSSAALPGPVEYAQLLSQTNPVYLAATWMFLFNTILSDGLLLYRCYIVYSSDYKFVLFPGAMYIASISLGLLTNIDLTRPHSIAWSTGNAFKLSLSFFSISFSLNILLTLMIVARLVLHNRRIQKMVNAGGGVYLSVAAMVVESSALYAVAVLLFFIPWALNKPLNFLFFAIVGNVEVISPFLIILRVANRRAFAGRTPTGATSPMKSSLAFRQTGTTTDGTVSSEYPMSTVDKDGKDLADRVIQVSKTVELNS